MTCRLQVSAWTEQTGRFALAYGLNSNGEVVLVDALADADPGEDGNQIGAQIVGTLGVMSEDGVGGGSPDGAQFEFNGLEVVLEGAIVPGEDSTTVQLRGDLDIDGTVGFGNLIVLDSFGLSGSLDWTLQNDLGGGELSIAVTQARTNGLTIGLGDFFEASAAGTDDEPVAINFSDDPETPIVEGLSVTLGSPAIGLYGGVSGLDILPGGLPDFDKLDGVVIGIEEGSMLDTLQDWFLPIRTSEIVVDFPDGFFSAPIGTDAEGNPLDPKLLIDGAVGLPGFIGEALGDIGVAAETSFAGLGIDIGELRSLAEQLLDAAGALGGEVFDAFIDASDDDAIRAAFTQGIAHIQANGLPFSIFDLGDAIDLSQLNALGMELGVELGKGFAVRGALSVGKVDANEQKDDAIDDVYFLAIEGAVRVSSYGGGGTLVLTTAGPIAATIEFGVPISLGPTTLTLGGGGGIIFGKDLLDGIDTSTPTVNPADIPTPLEFDLTDIPTIEGILTQLWDESTNSLTQVWNLPATLAIEGQLSSIAVAGLVSLEGTIAASLPSPEEALAGEGLSLLGVGDLNVAGLPLASGGVLVDARDLLNPAISFGFRAPPKDNPLSFLFTSQADLAGTFRSDGMIEAWLLGIQTLIRGTIENSQGQIAELLDVVAEDINLDRQMGLESPLDQLLALPEEPVTGESLRDGLLSVFDALTGDSPTGELDSTSDDPWIVAALVTGELWTEFQLAADRVPDFNFVEAIGDIFAGLFESVDEAFVRAFNAFNPSFVMRGAMQPSILGFRDRRSIQRSRPCDQQTDDHARPEGFKRPCIRGCSVASTRYR